MVIGFQTIKSQTVALDANAVTIKVTGTAVPSPYLIQASPRRTLEWFAIVDNSTRINYNYQKNHEYSEDFINLYFFFPQILLI